MNMQDCKSKISHDRAANSEASKWIITPTVDLALTCGGMMWVLLILFSALRTGAQAHSLLLVSLSFISAIAISYPHNAATVIRLYSNPVLRRRLWIQSCAAPVGLGLLTIAAVHNPLLLSALAQLYVLFIAQHFTAQSFGFTLIYCRKWNIRLSDRERTSIRWLLHATTGFAVVRQLVSPDLLNQVSSTPVVPWVQLPQWTLLVATALFAVALSAFTWTMLKRFQSTGTTLPLPGALVLFTSVTTFIVGPHLFGGLWFLVPTFFHGAQYLCITLVLQLKSKDPDGSPYAIRWLEQYGLTAVVGLGLYGLVPLLLVLTGASLPTAFFAAFCAINLHHFLADSAIWRLHDPALAKQLFA
jgi:hypothetical protein